MNIRAMTIQDTDQVLCMMRVFYDSPAVLHKAPNTILLQDIADCVGECPFIEGYIFEEDGQIAGYAMTAKSYSTEYGGLCIWVEDIYIKPASRGVASGKHFWSIWRSSTGAGRFDSDWKRRMKTNMQSICTASRAIKSCPMCR